MIEINVDTNAATILDGYADKLKSFREPLGLVGAYLERKANIRFVTQTDPTGKKWAPLRPSTLARKKAGLPILTNTGNLRASIAFLPPSDKEVRVKPSVRYGIYHQTGTKRMVARPFMGFEKGDAEAISRIIKRYLENA